MCRTYAAVITNSAWISIPGIDSRRSSLNSHLPSDHSIIEAEPARKHSTQHCPLQSGSTPTRLVAAGKPTRPRRGECSRYQCSATWSPRLCSVTAIFPYAPSLARTKSSSATLPESKPSISVCTGHSGQRPLHDPIPLRYSVVRRPQCLPPRFRGCSHARQSARHRSAAVLG